MREAGYGRIVNITSWAMNGMRQLTVYGAAKGGVFSLTRSLAIEGAEHNIKCNSLSPSAATRMNVVTLREDSDLLKWMMTQPAELVAPAVAFLAHEDCPVNGESLAAVGGNVRRVFLSQTEGYTNSELTLETVRDNFDKVMDPTRSRIEVIPEPGEEIDAGARPYQPS
jgi:short-subunit dehydrogenase